MAIGKECAAKEGATDADIADAMAFKLPSTAAGKCLHACVGERIGCVSHSHHCKEKFGDTSNRRIYNKTKNITLIVFDS